MTNERRLIDANAAIERLKLEGVSRYPQSWGMGLLAAMETLRGLPTVDAEEVVRCKDCRYSGMYCFGNSSEKVLACQDIEDDGFVRFAKSVDPNDFCSAGERRADNDAR